MDIHFILWAVRQYFIYFVAQIILWQLTTLLGDAYVPLTYSHHCEVCFVLVCFF